MSDECERLFSSAKLTVAARVESARAITDHTPNITSKRAGVTRLRGYYYYRADFIL